MYFPITPHAGMKMKKYLRWYFYPIIYFGVTGLVCLYAWVSRPASHRAGIGIIFNTVSLIPSLIGATMVTLWAGISLIVFIVSFQLKKRYPNAHLWAWTERLAEVGKGPTITPKEQESPYSFGRKLMNISVYLLGCILVTAGLMLTVWITRPYITLLLSTSRIEALEQKVKRGQIQGNRIIIPSVLVDAPILEGVSPGQLMQGVCHTSNTPAPGEGSNCIIEGHNLAEFGWWKSQSFFSMLELVDRGTPIYVFYNGKKYIYKVREKTYKSVNDPKLYDITPGEKLTLLTCVSTWSPTIYTNRRTVIVAYISA
jgi:LPXTG-site transpeptidase (sortase) family protein